MPAPTICPGAAVPSDAVPSELVEWLVETAGRAPSLHNSQPWRFVHAADGQLELWADRSRWIRFTDPAGRELVLSCGAALFTLEVALRARGATAVIDLLPEAASPDLLARVGTREGPPPNATDRALLRAVLRRHTHRSGFTQEPVDVSLRVAMQRAAERPGARLHLLEGLRERAVAARLTAQGARLRRDRALLQAEQRFWSAADTARRTGVPATARGSGRHPFGLAGRFDDDTGQSGAGPMQGPVLAILCTSADAPADWLTAGRALQHVLLLAASAWVFADIDSQALEDKGLRRSLARQLHLPGTPQLLFALGHAGVAPLTPRRPVEEVLTRR